MPESLLEKYLTRPEHEHLREILLNRSMNKKHSIYFFIVDDLRALYDDLTEEQLQKLALVNYTYFRGVLLVDSVVDLDASHPEKSIFDALNLIEASIQELSWLIDSKDIFWTKFRESKIQYAKAVLREKHIRNSEEVINQELFEHIYESKSASLAYNLINAFESVGKGKREGVASLLKQLLKHIHLAYQFRDDIDDFRTDLRKSQYSYAIHLVEKRLSQIERSAEPDFKYKYLFTSGVAEFLICESMLHFNKALNISESLDLKMFNDHIVSALAQCQLQIDEINALIKKTKVKLTKGSTLLFEDFDDADEGQINESIEKAIQYLLDNLEDSGWKDFLTSAGLSDGWVTSYTSYHLLKHGLAGLPSSNFLGSFNETVSQDGDTLSFTVGVAKLQQRRDLMGLLNMWLRFMQSDGGWRTYLDESSLRSRLNLETGTSVYGWTTPKSCVSAVAYNVLLEFEELKNEREATGRFLISHQTPEGSWESYWWTSDMYATAWAIKGLCKNKNYIPACEKGMSWIIDSRNTLGYWSDELDNLPSPFFTALATEAILMVKGPMRDLRSSLNWLLKSQCRDGSWPSSRILAIPATHIDDRKQVKAWRRSSFGVNTLVDDHNRIFTTVTVLSALQTWKSLSQ